MCNFSIIMMWRTSLSWIIIDYSLLIDFIIIMMIFTMFCEDFSCFSWWCCGICGQRVNGKRRKRISSCQLDALLAALFLNRCGEAEKGVDRNWLPRKCGKCEKNLKNVGNVENMPGTYLDHDLTAFFSIKINIIMTI